MSAKLFDSQDEEPLFTMEDDDGSDEERGKLVGNTEEYNRKTRNQNLVSDGLQKSRLGKSHAPRAHEERGVKQKAQLLKKETIQVQNKLFKSFDISKYTAEDDEVQGLQQEVEEDAVDDSGNFEFKFPAQEQTVPKNEFRWLSSSKDKNEANEQQLETNTEKVNQVCDSTIQESLLVSQTNIPGIDQTKQNRLVASLL